MLLRLNGRVRANHPLGLRGDDGGRVHLRVGDLDGAQPRAVRWVGGCRRGLSTIVVETVKYSSQKYNNIIISLR